MSKTLNVAMIGHAFMGRAHSQGWRTVGHVFDLPLEPRMHVLCGRNAANALAAAGRLGWGEVTDDWRAAIQREDVDAVDICAPGSLHAEIAIAALRAGKHVLCEKPMANTVEEAEAMVAAADSAAEHGVQAMVAFNYRRVPAVALARQMIADGRLGDIRHVRATYLQDWIVDPQFPLVWRLDANQAGSGALGDIGAHIIDLSQFLLGEELDSVSGLTQTFVRRRPLAADPDDPAFVPPAGEMGDVTVDDAALFLGRFGSGAVATFEATRFATGRKNSLRIEVNGSGGSLVFDLERLNELQFHDAEAPAFEQGFRTILVTEHDHPYMAAWWPPGHVIGWEHSFTHEIRDFVHAIAEGAPVQPDFRAGLQVQRVLDAVTRSAEHRRWQSMHAS
jgi:predicted dehydrogenase